MLRLVPPMPRGRRWWTLSPPRWPQTSQKPAERSWSRALVAWVTGSLTVAILPEQAVGVAEVELGVAAASDGPGDAGAALSDAVLVGGHDALVAAPPSVLDR